MTEIVWCHRHGPAMMIPYVQECPMCAAEAARLFMVECVERYDLRSEHGRHDLQEFLDRVREDSDSGGN